MTTRAQIIETARGRVQNLYVSLIDAKPDNFDWSASGADGDAAWDSMEAVHCDGCDTYIVDEFDHGFISPDGQLVPQGALLEANELNEDELDEWAEANGFRPCPRMGDDYREFSSAEGPMMNYRYPLGESDYGVNAARKIADLPLCLVEMDNGDIYLALTGGGMDLSWEICEAYIRLGYLPPSYFELPAMADKFLTERTALILAAVERSNEVLAGWAQRRKSTATTMLAELAIKED